MSSRQRSTTPRRPTELEPATAGRRPTMEDVAVHLGVSRALVSLVLSNAPGPSAASRVRIQQAAVELGYQPDTGAQALRRGRSRHLGVLFTMHQPHDVDLVEHIYPAAEALGYQVALGAIGPARDEQQAVQRLLGYRIEALILIGPYLGRAGLETMVRQLPVVEIGRRVNAAGVDSVRTADSRGAQLAVDHLVELGHRSIVHIDGGDLPGADERRRGYRKAMRRHGLDRQIKILPGDYTEESGATTARELLADAMPTAMPTAVLAGNDNCAHGLLTTLFRAGVRVPDDISVVGYDDSPIARMSFIDLTTIRQDTTAMAKLAVQAADNRLEERPSERRDLILDPTLVIRGTTGPPKA